MDASNQILRARWHDYYDKGFYMITMNVEDRATRPFGEIVGDSEDTAYVKLTPLGSRVAEVLSGLQQFYPEIEVVHSVVMPDHCHLLIEVQSTMAKHLGAVVRAIKSVTTKAYLQALDAAEGGFHLLNRDLSKAQHQRDRQADANIASQVGGSTAAVAGASGGLSAITSAHVSGGGAVGCNSSAPIYVPGLWAEGYHDRIVTRYGQIAILKRYITRNPARLWLKYHADSSLMAVHDVRIPIAFELAQQMKDFALYWDAHRPKVQSPFAFRHDGTVYARTYLELVQKFLRKKRNAPTTHQNSTPLPPASSHGAGSQQDASLPPASCHGTGSQLDDALPPASGHGAGCQQDVVMPPASSHGAGSQQDDAITPFLALRVCGNYALLDAGRPLVRVRISRSVTREQLQDEMLRLLGLCEREGAVLVSPFISWSEKEVLKAARMNGYPHIVVMGEAMPHVFKPSDAVRDVQSQYVPEWYAKAPLVGLLNANAADKRQQTPPQKGTPPAPSQQKGTLPVPSQQKGTPPVLSPQKGTPPAPLQQKGITSVPSPNNGTASVPMRSDMDCIIAGEMLLLAPWADRPKSEKAGKAECELMNELCRLLTTS